ncbi:MAG: HIT family protein [Candidatus Woesearchaeota archaeon]
MACAICDLLKEKKGMLFEDEQIAILLAPKPAVPGHIILAPKTHAAILEQVPDFMIGKMFDKANKVSIAVFEALGAEGTNIIVNNGIAAGQSVNHFLINVIPRRENDNLNILWQPKQLSEEEMSTIELQLKEESKGIGVFEKEKEKPKEEKKPEEIKEEEEENYLLKQLERLP